MNRNFNQVILPLNLGINILENDSVRKLNEIVTVPIFDGYLKNADLKKNTKKQN